MTADVGLEKLSVRSYIEELLIDANCKNPHEINGNINCQCPFHRPLRNTSAFGISFLKEDEGYPFQCFGCGRTGTIIHLIMYLKDCNYKKAERLFFKRILIPSIDLNSLRRKLRKIDVEISQEIEDDALVELPPKGSPESMITYLKDRNVEKHNGLLNIRVIKSVYGFYYCSEGYYSRRIIMPVKNLKGTTIYFTNRSIDDDVKKTLHPKGIKQDKHIYGLYETNGNEKVIIVEGPFDVFQIFSAMGLMNIRGIGVIAILGTAMNEERASIIGDTFKEAYLLFDEDEPGQKADEKSIELLSDYMRTISLKEILNWGKDPGSATKQHLRRIFAKVGSL